MSVDHPNILLVEDDPSQREVLTYNLQAEAFKVICADNGEDALVIGGRRRTRSYSVGLDDAQSVGYRGVPPPQVSRSKPGLYPLLCCRPDPRKWTKFAVLKLGQTTIW